jgi:hypothetical protein
VTVLHGRHLRLGTNRDAAPQKPFSELLAPQKAENARALMQPAAAKGLWRQAAVDVRPGKCGLQLSA